MLPMTPATATRNEQHMFCYKLENQKVKIYTGQGDTNVQYI